MAISTLAHCPACKEELLIGLPLDITVVIAVGKAFAKSHKLRCKAVTFMGPAREKTGDQAAPSETSNG